MTFKRQTEAACVQIFQASEIFEGNANLECIFITDLSWPENHTF